MKILTLILLFLTAVVAGCGAAPTKPPLACTPGEQIEFTDRLRFVKIDPSLTIKPGTKADTWDLPAGTTYNEGAAAARRRGVLLNQCHIQFDQIEAVQGSDLTD